jgi:hypothetical protein
MALSTPIRNQPVLYTSPLPVLGRFGGASVTSESPPAPMLELEPGMLVPVTKLLADTTGPEFGTKLEDP